MTAGFHPHLGILPAPQRRLWDELESVPGEFVLYGGTALALHLGHRQSLDFDFFGKNLFDPGTLAARIPPYFLMTVTPVPGSNEPWHTVLIPDGGASRERYFHHIAFTVSTGGAKIFDSAPNPIRLDCNALLAHNCLEAAEMMINDHQDLVDSRGVGLIYVNMQRGHRGRHS
jgi:hypothetical protein